MSGFQHASVTKGMMMILGVTSLSVSLLDLKPYFHLQLVPHMTKYHQFWRILFHPFVFTNSTELLMGELLLYNIGITVERSFGPRKYASFVLVSTIVSALIALSTIILFNPLGLNSIPAGPYGVIFSLLWQHYRTIPSLYIFKIFGLELSSKVFQWIFALQLFFSDFPSSILASVCGLIAGYLYRTDTLLLPSLRHRRVLRPLKSYRIPMSVFSIISRVLNPLVVGTSAPPRRANRVLPGQISDSARTTATARTTFASILASRMNDDANGGGGGATRRPNQTPAATPNAATATRSGARAAMGEWVNEMTGRGQGGARAPTETEIATLSSMFPNMSREAIVRALQRNDYNTAQAVEALLQET